MSEHTPGPWRRSGANTVHGADCIVAFVGTSDEEVRRVGGERQSADARLIAAAPDLLAALEDLLPYLEDCRMDKKARAAIAKARGK
jgi:hypothetical protein